MNKYALFIDLFLPHQKVMEGNLSEIEDYLNNRFGPLKPDNCLNNLTQINIPDGDGGDSEYSILIKEA